jgi:hypothetical protein
MSQSIPGHKYEVAITYCDGIVFTHSHETATDATTEYGAMLSEALVPTKGSHARHVRQVTLLSFNELNELVHHIDTGVFPCTHRPVTALGKKMAGSAERVKD